MTTCEWVRANGVALAALRVGDSEHDRAFAHAPTCPACARALDEGRRVLDLLGSDAPDPSSALLRKTSGAVLARFGTIAARRAPRWRFRLALVPAVALGWVMLLVMARARFPESAVWKESFVVLGLALVVAIVAATHRALALGFALAASAALAAHGAAHGAAPGGLGSAGAKCIVLEIVASLPALLVTLVLVAKGRLPRTPALAPAAAALGALAGQAALHLTCPDHTAGPHLFAFHLGGVVLAALVGSFAASRRGPSAPA